MQHQFKNNIDVVLILTKIDHMDNMRMFQLIKRFQLLHHKFFVDIVLFQSCLTNYLDCHWPVCSDMMSFVYFTIGTLTKKFAHLVELANIFDLFVCSEHSEIQFLLNSSRAYLFLFVSNTGHSV